MKTDSSRLPSLLAGSAALLTVACGASDGGPTGLSLAGGRLDVSVTATGVDVPGAFTVALDADAPRSVDANGAVAFASVTSGAHALLLGDVPPNCSVAGDNPREVAISAGASIDVAFLVTCVRSVGTVGVTASTTGIPADADGYLVTLDAGPPRTLAIDDTVTFSAVPTGEHPVELSGASPNCGVRGHNPVTVTVLSRERSDVTFRVECLADAGALRLTTFTTGPGTDGDGFIALVDEDDIHPIGSNAVRLIGGLAAGPHVVELGDVAEHCTVTSDNPAAFSVAADAATDVTLTVECADGGDLAPTVTISSPDTTSSAVPLRVRPGTPVTFVGRAVDTEGRELPGSALSWSSNLDGELGVGTSVTAGTLSEGQHTVTLTADDGSGPGTETVLVVVVTAPMPGYQIKLRLTEGLTLTPGQKAAIEGALDRLTSIVVGDLPDVPFETSAFSCGASIPPIDETIDDLILYLAISPIDGPGGILGAATPCIEREGSELPALGGMVFDVFDLAAIEEAGFLDELLLHEAMHVMGFGSIWRSLGRLQLPSNPNGGGTAGNDTYFDGDAAIEQFLALGGSDYTGGNIVPVENDAERFGSGSLDGHWREGVLGHEIMTSALNTAAPANPLSAITVGQFADLGYVVDLGAAEPYVQDFSWRLPGAGEAGRTFVLEGDVLPGPLWIVGADGTRRRVR